MSENEGFLEFEFQKSSLSLGLAKFDLLLVLNALPQHVDFLWLECCIHNRIWIFLFCFSDVWQELHSGIQFMIILPCGLHGLKGHKLCVTCQIQFHYKVLGFDPSPWFQALVIQMQKGGKLHFGIITGLVEPWSSAPINSCLPCSSVIMGYVCIIMRFMLHLMY